MDNVSSGNGGWIYEQSYFAKPERSCGGNTENRVTGYLWDQLCSEVSFNSSSTTQACKNITRVFLAEFPVSIKLDHEKNNIMTNKDTISPSYVHSGHHLINLSSWHLTSLIMGQGYRLLTRSNTIDCTLQRFRQWQDDRFATLWRMKGHSLSRMQWLDDRLWLVGTKAWSRDKAAWAPYWTPGRAPRSPPIDFYSTIDPRWTLN
jgi:hypothetical protein